MDQLRSYNEIHVQVRMILQRSLIHYYGDESRVFDSLMEVETIREAVGGLMGIQGAEFAVEILLGILAEAQLVKVNRSELDNDVFLFQDCRNDELMHDLIRVFLKRP